MLPSRFTDARLIDTGGFASVYAAKDPQMGDVAVKSPKNLTHEELERFAREVELQSELSHPNIVEVLDFDLDESPPWYAMAMATGNLGQAAATGAWDDSVLLGLFGDVLSGVGHAHGQHVLHRDLKPGNVLVYTDQGFPVARVADFGFGRWFTRDRMKFQTKTAFAAGTEYYTAPEQWDDFREVTETADVFSLGRILDRMMSLRPSLAKTNPQLVDCIRVATRTDPLERYQSVEQLAVAIGLATANPAFMISPQENLAVAMQVVISDPEDSIAVDRLMDALEKLGQDAGPLGVALGRIPEFALRALCDRHPGRLRSLLLALTSIEAPPEPVDAALRACSFFEICLDFATDDNLRGIALFGLARLASIYEMDEFIGPALHRLYLANDSPTHGVLRSLLAKDDSVLRWLIGNADRSKLSFDLEGA